MRRVIVFPAINRWANIIRPYGANIFDFIYKKDVNARAEEKTHGLRHTRLLPTRRSPFYRANLKIIIHLELLTK
jgi:hypothetical protein